MPKRVPTQRNGQTYFLTRQVGERHGVNVGRALHEGVVSTDDLSEMLARCRACPDHAGEDVSAHEAEVLPDTCANRDLLQNLRGLV
jgi:hypothetical protein